MSVLLDVLSNTTPPSNDGGKLTAAVTVSASTIAGTQAAEKVTFLADTVIGIMSLADWITIVATIFGFIGCLSGLGFFRFVKRLLKRGRPHSGFYKHLRRLLKRGRLP